MGKLAGMGTAGRTAVRAGQGAGLASAEATARTLLEEGRMPTQEEYASTVLFGGAFGGTIGAAEARWLGKNLGADIPEGATRPEVIDSVADTITEANGIENVKVGNPVIEQIIGNNLDGISNPKVAAEELLKATEAQLLKESEAAVSAAAKTQKPPDTLSLDDTMQILTTPNVANVGGEGGAMTARARRYDDETGIALRNLLDRDAAQQDELFGFINDKKTIVKGDLADTTELRRISERLSMLDHKFGKNKGAKKERAKLNAARNRIHNRHGLLDLEATMQGRQIGEARQPTKDMPFKDRPMKGAGMAGKYEAMAKKYLGENYEKMFGGLLSTGAGGAAIASTISDEDREGMSRAGLGQLALLLMAAGLGVTGYKRFRKTPTFNRINEQVKRNPKGTEPDIVQQDRVNAQAEKGAYQAPDEFSKMWDSAKDVVRNTLEPLSRTLKNINPLINRVFRDHERRINLRTREYLDRISPFITTMSAKLKGREGGSAIVQAVFA